MERLVLWQRLVSGAREEDRDPKVELAWLKRVVARVAAEGGDTIAIVGGSVVACFDAIDVTTAIDLSLSLVEEAEIDDDPTSAVRLAIGVATGDVRVDQSNVAKHVFHVGSPFDRAQLLANRARVGEVVVDSATRDACGAFFLFQRVVNSGESTIRGHSIDRTTPRLEACRANLARLAPLPLPPSFAPATDELRAIAKREGAQLVVLRGPMGAGASQLVEHVVSLVNPSLVLRVPPAPGGHEPLGSLRAALLYASNAVGGIETLAASLDAVSIGSLRAIATGEAIALPAAVDAMAALLKSTRGARSKPWIVLDPITGADTSTLQLVGELVQRPGLTLLVVGRARGETKVPAALSWGRPFPEILISLPKTDEARRLAEGILVSIADADLARRIVALSGESPIAVLETIRWLVSIGDIVYSTRGFRFRIAPRVSSKVVPLDAVYAERIATLDPDAQRLLEIIATVPCGFGDAFLGAIARADGLEPRNAKEAKLALEALCLPTDTRTITATEPLRDAIFRGMPPARSGELARFVADELARMPRTGGFTSATHAHYLAEGGQPVEAAAIFLLAAEKAAAHQHGRAAIRLAAAAVELDPSASTRDASSRIVRSVSTKPRRSIPPQTPTEMATLPPPSRDPDSAGKLAASAIGALRARDFEGVERYIDTAIAQGGSLVAAERLRALAHLSRGDRRSATISLGRARGFAAEDRAERARNGLLDAWLHISNGAHREALRSALLALAGARTAADALGERAAMRTVAVCLELLGRKEDASALRTGTV